MSRNTDGVTDYSEEVAGVTGNFKQPVSFDFTDGYVGITQYSGPKVACEVREIRDRVLLSPDQWGALVEFVACRRRRRTR